MPPTLGAAALRQAITLALESLRAHQVQIDDANVYPVPDADTGTNLVMTVEAVANALTGTPNRAPDVARAITEASLAGARGNSGAILAQFLRGLCEHMTADGLDRDGAAAAYKRAAELAYTAMHAPREGTALTVARAAADAAQEGDGLAGVVDRAAKAAWDALERTPDLLPILRTEGVVDAGGIGLCIVLDAIASAVSGRPAQPIPPLAGPRPVRPREMGSMDFAYEVQYLLDAPDDAIPELRARLATIGDSVAVIGGDGTWNIHVHTNDVGHAIELGVDVGRAHSISVVEFEEQIAETRGLPLAISPAPVAVVAIVDGDGLRAVYAELGAVVVSAEDATKTIRAVSAPNVIVLANGAVVSPEDGEKTVEVLETTDSAQGFAALLAFAPTRNFLDNLAQMRASVARSRTAGTNTDDAVAAARSLGDGEILTVFAAATVKSHQRRKLQERLDGAFPSWEIEIRDGGQPAPDLLMVLE